MKKFKHVVLSEHAIKRAKERTNMAPEEIITQITDKKLKVIGNDPNTGFLHVWIISPHSKEYYRLIIDYKSTTVVTILKADFNTKKLINVNRTLSRFNILKRMEEHKLSKQTCIIKIICNDNTCIEQQSTADRNSILNNYSNVLKRLVNLNVPTSQIKKATITNEEQTINIKEDFIKYTNNKKYIFDKNVQFCFKYNKLNKISVKYTKEDVLKCNNVNINDIIDWNNNVNPEEQFNDSDLQNIITKTKAIYTDIVTLHIKSNFKLKKEYLKYSLNRDSLIQNALDWNNHVLDIKKEVTTHELISLVELIEKRKNSIAFKNLISWNKQENHKFEKKHAKKIISIAKLFVYDNTELHPTFHLYKYVKPIVT